MSPKKPVNNKNKAASDAAGEAQPQDLLKRRLLQVSRDIASAQLSVEQARLSKLKGVEKKALQGGPSQLNKAGFSDITALRQKIASVSSKCQERSQRIDKLNTDDLSEENYAALKATLSQETVDPVQLACMMHVFYDLHEKQIVSLNPEQEATSGFVEKLFAKASQQFDQYNSAQKNSFHSMLNHYKSPMVYQIKLFANLADANALLSDETLQQGRSGFGLAESIQLLLPFNSHSSVSYVKHLKQNIGALNTTLKQTGVVVDLGTGKINKGAKPLSKTEQMNISILQGTWRRLSVHQKNIATSRGLPVLSAERIARLENFLLQPTIPSRTLAHLLHVFYPFVEELSKPGFTVQASEKPVYDFAKRLFDKAKADIIEYKDGEQAAFYAELKVYNDSTTKNLQAFITMPQQFDLLVAAESQEGRSHAALGQAMQMIAPTNLIDLSQYTTLLNEKKAGFVAKYNNKHQQYQALKNQKKPISTQVTSELRDLDFYIKLFDNRIKGLARVQASRSSAYLTDFRYEKLAELMTKDLTPRAMAHLVYTLNDSYDAFFMLFAQQTDAEIKNAQLAVQLFSKLWKAVSQYSSEDKKAFIGEIKLYNNPAKVGKLITWLNFSSQFLFTEVLENKDFDDSCFADAGYDFFKLYFDKAVLDAETSQAAFIGVLNGLSKKMAVGSQVAEYCVRYIAESLNGWPGYGSLVKTIFADPKIKAKLPMEDLLKFAAHVDYGSFKALANTLNEKETLDALHAILQLGSGDLTAQYCVRYITKSLDAWRYGSAVKNIFKTKTANTQLFEGGVLTVAANTDYAYFKRLVDTFSADDACEYVKTIIELDKPDGKLLASVLQYVGDALMMKGVNSIKAAFVDKSLLTSKFIERASRCKALLLSFGVSASTSWYSANRLAAEDKINLYASKVIGVQGSKQLIVQIAKVLDYSMPDGMLSALFTSNKATDTSKKFGKQLILRMFEDFPADRVSDKKTSDIYAKMVEAYGAESLKEALGDKRIDSLVRALGVDKLFELFMAQDKTGRIDLTVANKQNAEFLLAILNNVTPLTFDQVFGGASLAKIKDVKVAAFIASAILTRTPLMTHFNLGATGCQALTNKLIYSEIVSSSTAATGLPIPEFFLEYLEDVVDFLVKQNQLSVQSIPVIPGEQRKYDPAFLPVTSELLIYLNNPPINTVDCKAKLININSDFIKHLAGKVGLDFISTPNKLAGNGYCLTDQAFTVCLNAQSKEIQHTAISYLARDLAAAGDEADYLSVKTLMTKYVAQQLFDNGYNAEVDYFAFEHSTVMAKIMLTIPAAVELLSKNKGATGLRQEKYSRKYRIVRAISLIDAAEFKSVIKQMLETLAPDALKAVFVALKETDLTTQRSTALVEGIDFKTCKAFRKAFVKELILNRLLTTPEAVQDNELADVINIIGAVEFYNVVFENSSHPGIPKAANFLLTYKKGIYFNELDEDLDFDANAALKMLVAHVGEYDLIAEKIYTSNKALFGRVLGHLPLRDDGAILSAFVACIQIELAPTKLAIPSKLRLEILKTPGIVGHKNFTQADVQQLISHKLNYDQVHDYLAQVFGESSIFSENATKQKVAAAAVNSMVNWLQPANFTTVPSKLRILLLSTPELIENVSLSESAIKTALGKLTADEVVGVLNSFYGNVDPTSAYYKKMIGGIAEFTDAKLNAWFTHLDDKIRVFVLKNPEVINRFGKRCKPAIKKLFGKLSTDEAVDYLSWFYSAELDNNEYNNAVKEAVAELVKSQLDAWTSRMPSKLRLAVLKNPVLALELEALTADENSVGFTKKLFAHLTKDVVTSVGDVTKEGEITEFFAWFSSEEGQSASVEYRTCIVEAAKAFTGEQLANLFSSLSKTFVLNILRSSEMTAAFGETLLKQAASSVLKDQDVLRFITEHAKEANLPADYKQAIQNVMLYYIREGLAKTTSTVLPALRNFVLRDASMVGELTQSEIIQLFNRLDHTYLGTSRKAAKSQPGVQRSRSLNDMSVATIPGDTGPALNRTQSSGALSANTEPVSRDITAAKYVVDLYELDFEFEFDVLNKVESAITSHLLDSMAKAVTISKALATAVLGHKALRVELIAVNKSNDIFPLYELAKRMSTDDSFKALKTIELAIELHEERPADGPLLAWMAKLSQKQIAELIVHAEENSDGYQKVIYKIIASRLNAILSEPLSSVKQDLRKKVLSNKVLLQALYQFKTSRFNPVKQLVAKFHSKERLDILKDNATIASLLSSQDIFDLIKGLDGAQICQILLSDDEAVGSILEHLDANTIEQLFESLSDVQRHYVIHYVAKRGEDDELLQKVDKGIQQWLIGTRGLMSASRLNILDVFVPGYLNGVKIPGMKSNGYPCYYDKYSKRLFWKHSDDDTNKSLCSSDEREPQYYNPFTGRINTLPEDSLDYDDIIYREVKDYLASAVLTSPDLIKKFAGDTGGLSMLLTRYKGDITLEMCASVDGEVLASCADLLHDLRNDLSYTKQSRITKGFVTHFTGDLKYLNGEGKPDTEAAFLFGGGSTNEDHDQYGSLRAFVVTEAPEKIITALANNYINGLNAYLKTGTISTPAEFEEGVVNPFDDWASSDDQNQEMFNPFAEDGFNIEAVSEMPAEPADDTFNTAIAAELLYKPISSTTFTVDEPKKLLELVDRFAACDLTREVTVKNKQGNKKQKTSSLSKEAAHRVTGALIEALIINDVDKALKDQLPDLIRKWSNFGATFEEKIGLLAKIRADRVNADLKVKNHQAALKKAPEQNRVALQEKAQQSEKARAKVYGQVPGKVMHALALSIYTHDASRLAELTKPGKDFSIWTPTYSLMSNIKAGNRNVARWANFKSSEIATMGGMLHGTDVQKAYDACSTNVEKQAFARGLNLLDNQGCFKKCFKQASRFIREINRDIKHNTNHFTRNALKVRRFRNTRLNVASAGFYAWRGAKAVGRGVAAPFKALGRMLGLMAKPVAEKSPIELSSVQAAHALDVGAVKKVEPKQRQTVREREMSVTTQSEEINLDPQRLAAFFGGEEQLSTEPVDGSLWNGGENVYDQPAVSNISFDNPFYEPSDSSEEGSGLDFEPFEPVIVSSTASMLNRASAVPISQQLESESSPLLSTSPSQVSYGAVGQDEPSVPPAPAKPQAKVNFDVAKALDNGNNAFNAFALRLINGFERSEFDALIEYGRFDKFFDKAYAVTFTGAQHNDHASAMNKRLHFIQFLRQVPGNNERQEQLGSMLKDYAASLLDVDESGENVDFALGKLSEVMGLSLIVARNGEVNNIHLSDASNAPRFILANSGAQWNAILPRQITAATESEISPALHRLNDLAQSVKAIKQRQSIRPAAKELRIREAFANAFSTMNWASDGDNLQANYQQLAIENGIRIREITVQQATSCADDVTAANQQRDLGNNFVFPIHG